MPEVWRCGGRWRIGRSDCAGDLEDASEARGSESCVHRRGFPDGLGDDRNRVVGVAPLLV